MVDLLVLFISDQLLLILKKSVLKPSHLNKEANCTEPSPPVRGPWTNPQALLTAAKNFISQLLHSTYPTTISLRFAT
jgi:hypothetical protein